MISKTKINKRMQNKTNKNLARAIFLSKKTNPDIARRLALPRRRQIKVSIGQLNDSKGKVLIVPGKVLGSGNIGKKLEIYAFSYSEEARRKLLDAGCKVLSLTEALEKKSKFEGEIIE